VCETTEQVSSQRPVGRGAAWGASPYGRALMQLVYLMLARMASWLALLARSLERQGLERTWICRLLALGPERVAQLGSVQRMPIKLENVGIAVRDLEATIAFFTDLGLIVLGRDTVSGEWTDTAVGLDGNHANIAMLQTPDGNGRLELFEYIHPDAIETKPTRPNEIGMHRVAFSVDDIDEALEIAARHGCHPLRGVATYEDVYKLTYVRGPSGILVMLAEELKKN
jgi:glyoxylase I family protein